jgi:endoglucanase
VGPSILAKSIDDRIGVATVIELLKHAPSNVDICAAFTVQEEIGLRGAKVAAQYFCPDLAIAIDSTPANDLPVHDGSENMAYNTKLGLGPAIYIADGSTLHDPRLVRFLAEVGDAEKIPYQFRQPGGGGTDSGAIQRALAGIPTVSVSVPHRYTHSPVSIARIDDWKNTLNLLHAALKRITPQLISSR